MRKSSGLAGVALALAALSLFAAGPIMIYEGFHGQSQIKQELVAQKIVFPAKGSGGLPAGLQAYGGMTVATGPQAKAYADMVEIHVREATGGKTYSEVSNAWIAGGMKDVTLAQQRQTAFMGESLRGSLMSAYQAWELSWLVIGLGALFFGLSVVFGAAAYGLRPGRMVVPELDGAVEPAPVGRRCRSRSRGSRHHRGAVSGCLASGR